MSSWDDLLHNLVDQSSEDEGAEAVTTAADEQPAVCLQRSNSDSILSSQSIQGGRGLIQALRRTPSKNAATSAQQRVNAFFLAKRHTNRETKRLQAYQQVSKLLEDRQHGSRSMPKSADAFCSSSSSRLIPSRSATLIDSGVQLIHSKVQGSHSVLPPSLSPLVPAKHRPRRRIAIVGGGPVGLWAATLLMQRHARRLRRASTSHKSSQPSFSRNSDAPEIVIFERRSYEEHHTRNRRIFLDDRAVTLLNKHARPACFATSAVLSEIEKVLLNQWRNLAGEKSIRFGSKIDRPSDVFAHGNWDLVLWAGGRRSLDDIERQHLGCSVHLGETENVLVFELRGFSPSQRAGASKVTVDDISKLAAVDLTSCAQQAGLAEVPLQQGFSQAAVCPRQIVMRCAPDGPKKTPVAWLWLLGVPPELLSAKASQTGSKAEDPGVHATLADALDAELKVLGLDSSSCMQDVAGNCSETPPTCSRSISRLRAAVAALQDQLFCPTEVSARWVDASYWSSDRMVCTVPGHESGGQTPLVLIGDAAMGKPFHLGTTLDIHLEEVKKLSKHPAIAWGLGELEPSACLHADATDGEEGRSREKRILGALQSIESQYQDMIRHCTGFRR